MLNRLCSLEKSMRVLSEAAQALRNSWGKWGDMSEQFNEMDAQIKDLQEWVQTMTDEMNQIAALPSRTPFELQTMEHDSQMIQTVNNIIAQKKSLFASYVATYNANNPEHPYTGDMDP